MKYLQGGTNPKPLNLKANTSPREGEGFRQTNPQPCIRSRTNKDRNRNEKGRTITRAALGLNFCSLLNGVDSFQFLVNQALRERRIRKRRGLLFA